MEKSYTTASLQLHTFDVNPWLVSSKNYANCLHKFFSVHNTTKLLENQLKSEDINSICKEELEGLRSVAPEIRLKEVCGTQSLPIRCDFYDELKVKKLA
jgi:hypothetical protein